jgi:hypothetical protein
MICNYCGTEYHFNNPNCDCLDRILCDKVGEPGHYNCGYCEYHKCPRFQCGCMKYKNEENKNG